jgi:hypothetical protein
MLQALTVQHDIPCFKIRKLKIQPLAQRQENSMAPSKVLPSGADQATLLGSQFHLNPKFQGHQNHLNGTHCNAMIEVFMALLDNMYDASHPHDNIPPHVSVYQAWQS